MWAETRAASESSLLAPLPDCDTLVERETTAVVEVDRSSPRVTLVVECSGRPKHAK